jgi:integrase/recombinase XerD
MAGRRGMTGIRQAIGDYLAVRRALGYKLEDHGWLLADFASFLEAAGARTVTTRLALDWATLPQDALPSWHAARLRVVRGFARHLQALDPATEVPPAGLLPGRTRRAVPYLYSDAEVAALMAATACLRPALHAATHETLIGLLSATGMFSRGEDRCKSGVLADRVGSGVVINPPSPWRVVVHVAGPRRPSF